MADPIPLPLPRQLAGQPTKLTEPVIRILQSAIRVGLSAEMACCKAHISTSSFWTWKNKGANDRVNGEVSVYTVLLDSMESAQAEMLEDALGSIATAARDGEWRAGAWLAERTRPQDYAARTELTGAGGGPVQVQTLVDVVRQAAEHAAQEAAADAAGRSIVLDNDGTPDSDG